ncbi:hypothetical protein BGZ80_001947 [Entomortierella chlamydospora]|uniref:Uncharacterized protein n=1 Tax=Entomortierella chlamydospora TaxID=101097 RepID=A0A9P6MRE1_9FUNG|nr:hypothetical protein BGZ79_009740 [Entomortierella chlamydospora]KAG0009909.1 hypothetical protein BGZ80_001947 [Entomortierella chlamydospora]
MNPRETDYSHWLTTATILLIYLYFAREYPRWRAQKLLKNPVNQQNPEKTSTASNDHSSTPDTSPPPPQPSSSSPWPDKFSLRWIPYLPFAVVYLVVKAIISGLRQLVLISLFAAENTSFFLKDTTEEAVQWSVNHGPEFVQTKVVVPVHTAAVTAWKSPALTTIRSKIETSVVPTIIQAAVSCLEKAQVAAEKTFVSILAQVEPTRIRLEWFAVECVYNPGKAVWVRLVILGGTFAHTAKIYLHELAKDARDLAQVSIKLANWIWTRALQPVGGKLYAFGETALDGMIVFLPWLAQNLYTRALRPAGAALIDGFHILRSHPTLLSGIQALSSKVQEKLNIALERLESVNWLFLLETALTSIFTSIHHYTTTGLQLTGNGIKVFATEIVPNAYGDLKMALEVARPVVAWAIEKFVKVAYPVWRAVSWISWTIAVNVGPTLAWLNEKVVLPAKKQWESTIYPGLAYASSLIVAHTKAMAELVVTAVPMISTVAGPIWVALVKMAEAMQVILGQMASQIIELSGRLAEHIKQYGTTLGPQIEAIKEQSTQMMDEAVVATSDFMMDWVKKEKRD